MTDAVEQRRALIQRLQAHSLVEDIDWTRDGYQTVVLSLGDPDADAPDELDECIVCGATGLSERIAAHDCQEFRAWKRGDA
jgi:hypothetical protein